MAGERSSATVNSWPTAGIRWLPGGGRLCGADLTFVIEGRLYRPEQSPEAMIAGLAGGCGMRGTTAGRQLRNVPLVWHGRTTTAGRLPVDGDHATQSRNPRLGCAPFGVRSLILPAPWRTLGEPWLAIVAFPLKLASAHGAGQKPPR